MKLRSFIALVVLSGGLLLSSTPAAAQIAGDNVKSSQRFESSKGGAGRVMNKSQRGADLQLHHGIVATINAMYYNGDIIKPWSMLINGAMGEQMSASLTLNYKLTFNVYVSMRFGLQGGFLRGSNEKELKKGDVSSLHKFNAIFLEPFAGVEVYPILNYGFFIYAGVGLLGCSHDYTHVRRSVTYTPNDSKFMTKFGLVPMGQFGVGYNWFIDANWTLGVELMGQIGFCDGRFFGVDGWPEKNAFVMNPPASAETIASETEKYGKAKLPDGWGQLGFVISYHF